MKTLILGGSNSRNSGGVFNAALKLGINLNKYCDVDVHYLMHDDEYSLEDKKLYEPLPVHNYSLKGPAKLGFSLDIYEQIFSINPDVVHTQTLWMYLSYVNKKYHAKTKAAYIISPHGMLDAWQLKQSFWKDFTKNAALKLYELKHLKQANCIHALCKSEYDSIREFGLHNPVAIIPNGTDLPEISFRNNNYWVSKRWVENENRKTLLFLSRIHPKKGLDNLLKAWALTSPHQHNWQLIIAGETTDKQYIDSLVDLTSKLRINNTVQFIGGQFSENKDACYKYADAFILPSFSEGLPMVILEAWSYNLPVIMTPFCNLPEGFNEHAAIMTDVIPESITDKMQELFLMNDQQRLIMGQNGRRLVEKKFTWKQVALNTAHLYNWVLGKADKPNFVFDKI